MARRSRTRVSLARTLRQLASKHAALIIGCLLCAGSAATLLMQTSEPGVEIPRLTSEVEGAAAGEDDARADEDDGASEASSSDGEEAQAAPSRARVHIDGAVAAPGVYEITGEDLRVVDVVEIAGGLAEDADVSQVNLAAPVGDADKVHIPRAGEAAQASSTSTVEATTSSSSSSASSLVNINQASEEELCELPGVGEATARKIIADRESAGPFASPEDLMRVSGIGEKKFASLKDLICV